MPPATMRAGQRIEKTMLVAQHWLSNPDDSSSGLPAFLCRPSLPAFPSPSDPCTDHTVPSVFASPCILQGSSRCDSGLRLPWTQAAVNSCAGTTSSLHHHHFQTVPCTMCKTELVKAPQCPRRVAKPCLHVYGLNAMQELDFTEMGTMPASEDGFVRCP